MNNNVNVNRNANVNNAYRHGGVVSGEEGAVAVGRRGAVAVGEEGFVGVGRYGGVVGGERYESYEGWRAVAGVATGIAVGTMLARPPSTSVTVVSGGSNYSYADGATTRQVAPRRRSLLPGRQRTGRRGHHHAAWGVHNCGDAGGVRAPVRLDLLPTGERRLPGGCGLALAFDSTSYDERYVDWAAPLQQTSLCETG